MTPHTPRSDKLTELTQKQDAQKAGSKRSKEEKQRLSKLKYPQQWHDVTVTRVTDVDAPSATLIGFKRRPDQSSVVSTGGMKEQDEAARKEEILKRTLAGEPISDSASVDEQLEKAHRQFAAHEDAIEFLQREIEREKDRLSAEYAKSYKPTYNKQFTALCATMLDLHAKWSEVYDGKRHLIDVGVGLRDGMYLNLPESFLGTPNDPYSDMADFFTTAKRDGFIKEVPQSLRIKVSK
jgi:hypothetical protein